MKRTAGIAAPLEALLPGDAYTNPTEGLQTALSLIQEAGFRYWEILNAASLFAKIEPETVRSFAQEAQVKLIGRLPFLEEASPRRGRAKGRSVDRAL